MTTFPRRFRALGAIFAILVFPVMGAAGQADDEAAAFLAAVAEPIFEGAAISPEMRPTFSLIEDDAPAAALYGGRDARLTTGLVLLVETPEELAAAIARLLALERIEMAGASTDKRFRVRARLPSQSALRGSISSVDEAMAAPGIEAARETLKNRHADGPSVEEIRSRARRADAEALELLRAATVPDAALLTLYRHLSRAGGSLFERADYEGRRILIEQIGWLEERVEEGESARRPEWRDLDSRLVALKQSLRP